MVDDNPPSEVAVVIPAFNAEAYLAESVSSALASEDVAVTVIVADDGSTDSTHELAVSMAARDARIIVATKANGGASSARNLGIAHLPSGTEFVYFLDADDRLHASALAVLAQHLTDHPDVVAVGAQHRRFSASGTTRPSRRSRFVPAFPVPRDLRDDELNTPFVSFLCATGNGTYYLFRRGVVEAVGPWDETLQSHEDADFLCRVALQGCVHFLPQSLSDIREVPGSLTSRGQAAGGGQLFDEKWSNASYIDSINRVGVDHRKAMRYKLTVHEPLRDLKVAGRHLARVARRAEKFEPLRVLSLTHHALNGLSGRAWRIQRRRAINAGRNFSTARVR